MLMIKLLANSATARSAVAAPSHSILSAARQGVPFIGIVLLTYMACSQRGDNPDADAHALMDSNALKSHTRAVVRVVFSTDDSLLASTGLDDSAVVWDVKKRKELHRLDHSRWVFGAGFSPDGQTLATGST